MAFPQTPLDLSVELFVDGAWSNITSDVYRRGMIEIKRGRENEESDAFTTCTLQLNNRLGKYSPRNPRSSLYGKIGRNTKLRVRQGTKTASALVLPGAPSGTASTPDAAVVDITGDIDIRAEITPTTWRPALNKAIATKWTSVAADQRSWDLLLAVGGYLLFFWSTDGTISTQLSAKSTVAVPEGTGRLAVRAVLDVNNGASGNTVTFYTSSSIGGSWTQLGAPVVTAGTTSLFNSSADLVIGGGMISSASNHLAGDVHKFELRNGIGGTVVANPDFTAYDTGVRSITDGTGLVWTINGNAEFSNDSTRFAGEVSAWPPRWDVTGRDVWVPIEVSGPLRRLGQGQAPLRSPMFRSMTADSQARVIAYYPCEDARDSQQVASGIGGAPLGAYTNVSKAEFAANTDFACSAALPKMNNGWFEGGVPGGEDTGELRIWSLLSVPVAGVATSVQVLNIRTSGTLGEAILELNPDGSMRIRMRDSAHNDVYLSANAAYAVNGKPALVGIWLQQRGPDIEWQTMRYDVASGVLNVASLTLAGYTFGHATSMAVGIGGQLGDTAMGHAAVIDRNTNAIYDIIGSTLAGWKGEATTDRVLRLSAENGQAATAKGGGALSEELGVQGLSGYFDLVKEAADADLGALGERRDFPAIHYRARESFYNQTPVVLNYHTDLGSPPEPTEDDEALRNDVTVTRKDGSSFRAIEETGPLSVLAPPDGVGRYDEGLTINMAADTQLGDQAGWRRHLGTIDEARFPKVHVNLARKNGSLISTLKPVDIGDRIQISNPPAWLPPENIDLLVQGYTETLGNFEWDIVFNCTPGSAWTIGVADSTDARADGISAIAADITNNATIMYVATTDGPVWTTDPAQMPIPLMVGGEEMSVTAISNALLANPGFETGVSPWTFGGGTGTQSSTQKHSGTFSGRFVPDGVSVTSAWLSEAIPCVEGAPITLSGWAWFTSSHTSKFSLSINFYTAAGVYISTQSAFQSGSAATWTQYSSTYTAPAGAAQMRAAPLLTGTPAAAQIWYVDDLVFGGVQKFTITRSVNSIVKAQTFGTTVELARAPRAGW
ncbi:hypothetical protein GCM10027258_62270 [Amycolatopsis stemonae]